MRTVKNKATKQAGVSPRSGVAPPKKNQFGQPGGNPRHNGSWKKEETTRYKLQQIAKMSDDELREVLDNKDGKYGRYEQEIARTILDLASMDPHKRWMVIEGLTNQDCGYPKQQVENKNVEIKGILPKKEKDEKH